MHACMRNREYVTHAFPKTFLRATRTFHTLSLPCFIFLCSSCVRACFSKAPIRSFLLHKSQHAVVLPDSGSTARLVNNGKLLTYNNLALLTINDLVKAHTHTHTPSHVKELNFEFPLFSTGSMELVTGAFWPGMKLMLIKTSLRIL